MAPLLKTVTEPLSPAQKKKARQEKQRQLNPLRAEKMHKARISGIYPATGLSRPPKYNIGCSGWFYWDWKELFYPKGLPTNQWFPYYAGQFDTVELNAPFYSWPTLGTVQSWSKQARDKRFIYTVKVCELITHIKRFSNTKTLVQDFGLIADILGEQMGCFLFQLPPSFHYTKQRLDTILGQLQHHRRNVVEFRHSSWWNDTVYDAFRETGTIFCSCSAPKLPDGLIQTADEIYIRFHGTEKWYRHDYSDAELMRWAKQIQASGAQHIWVYFNNDYDGYAIKNARTLLRLLENSGGDIH